MWPRVLALLAAAVVLIALAAATFTLSYSGIREIALLVRTGKRFGKVQVLLNGQLLATVKTAGKNGSRVVDVASFDKPQNGTITVVSTSGRKVRVDGLGVSQSPF